MASKVPLTSQLNWFALALQIVIAGTLVAIFTQRNDRTGIIYGAVLFVLLRQTLALTLSGEHRAGIRAVKRAEFDRAIRSFQESYDHFNKHPWLDKYRAVFILSPSAITFREMALVNIAFCHGQLGDGAACRAGYERALAEYPNSMLARTALNMLRSVS